MFYFRFCFSQHLTNFILSKRKTKDFKTMYVIIFPCSHKILQKPMPRQANALQNIFSDKSYGPDGGMASDNI